ncbi:O-antigen ligase family protein [Algibacillus agarilyticus]|uniref:O-antigen ligase family protein n=1 Tax=Algibacillus agarilyticus TaxID=2234133 RepID=UPI001E517619|nr:O-antigen ligase family protein [Algibacillus agarilyticus]
MVVSSIINHNQALAVASIFKWIFLIQLAALILKATDYDGFYKVVKVFSIAYTYTIILVFLSFILRVYKATEGDGSVSYVGGYFHEAVASVIIIGGMAVYSLLESEKKSNSNKFKIFAVFSLLLILINYRTTVLASLLLSASLLYIIFLNTNFVTKHVTIFTGVILCLIISLAGPSNTLERFQEIPQAIGQSANLFDYPENYTKDEKRLFSGRIYMWSNYIAEYLSGTNIQLILGRGMDSWKASFEKYAHNTFVSFLYELGILGLTLFSILILGLYRRIMTVKSSGVRYSLIGIFSSFLVLNLGTMPLWQIEGIILLAVILGTTEHHLHRGNYIVK